MQNALLVGLSRQMSLSHELDIVANNIANIDTTGFKSDRATFTEYLMPGARDNEFATGKDRRISFVQDRATWIDYSAGSMQRTGNPLDVAIDGKGYFVVQTPRGQRYTRNGALGINAAGELVTSNGDQVIGTNGPIILQPTDRDITKGRRFDVHGAARRHAEPGAGQHAGDAGRDRKIERAADCRNGADDPNHPQLFRHRRHPAAAGRPAAKFAAAAVASTEFIKLIVRKPDHARA
jgi:flagellar hook-basal body protein